MGWGVGWGWGDKLKYNDCECDSLISNMWVELAAAFVAGCLEINSVILCVGVVSCACVLARCWGKQLW